MVWHNWETEIQRRSTGVTGTTDIYDPNAGSLIIDYNNNGVKMPIIIYNAANDSIVFNNPIIPAFATKISVVWNVPHGAIAGMLKLNGDNGIGIEK